MKRKTIYVIGVAPKGMPKEIIIEKLELTDNDDEFDTDEFFNFDDYIDYIVEETQNEMEQGFYQTLALDEEDFKLLKDKINKL